MKGKYRTLSEMPKCLFCKTHFLTKMLNEKKLFSIPIIINFVELYEANNDPNNKPCAFNICSIFISKHTHIKYPT
jgi:hypothetical protein